MIRKKRWFGPWRLDRELGVWVRAYYCKGRYMGLGFKYVRAYPDWEYS